MNFTCFDVLSVCIFVIFLALTGHSPKSPFPLSEPGEHQFSTMMNVSFYDNRRGDREISLYIWYPAVLPPDAEPSKYNSDADPDQSGAPYPVILTSAKLGNYIAPHLATHWFVVVGVDKQDSEEHYTPWLIDYPLDQVAALDFVTVNQPKGLEGILDTDSAGAVGYSFGGYNTLALGGARFDPVYYLSQCEQLNSIVPPPLQWVYTKWICLDANNWGRFVTNMGEKITSSDDGLWQPITDERIRAVMPMAPSISWYYGKKDWQ